MKRKMVSVSKCKDGDILAEDVLNKMGTLVMPAKTVISDSIKDRLSSFKIMDVMILIPEDREEDENSSAIQQLKTNYGQKTQQIKMLLEDLANGKDMDSEKVNDITDFMYSKVTSSYDVVQLMSRIKSIGDMTYTHSMNVSMYSMLIGKWLGYSEKETKELMVAGVLHDIGKTKIPLEILRKNEPLTSEEAAIFKKHAAYGYEISKTIPNISGDVRQAILMHHEREDGSGYPLGVKGDKINAFAKIISLADAYDSLMCQRKGKRFNTPFEAIEEFNKQGLIYFDPKILMTFLARISNYYIGTKVKMSTGVIGEIVSILPQSISKPIVKIEDRFVDLSKNKRIEITGIVDETA
ncbi:HD-GYP domain-containing protein [Petroclostridium sp. X23]|uniref:HD-GYP domain-containing protein n=1 Tax=Petroclostridium sp. X23 TaxID=3045146 RepID=UPI0024AD9FD2|nr:HD-GYP domain-containing protein [Petroclostridium sp. X23]WHH61505.1 HD-GYP domain-containing protein [Petroclostridium sp. X23]